MAEIAFEKITPKKVPTEEPFACGHRACSGCGEVLALRLVCKALGNRSIAVSATGLTAMAGLGGDTVKVMGMFTSGSSGSSLLI